MATKRPTRRTTRPARARTQHAIRAPHPLTKLDRAVFARLARALESRGIKGARVRYTLVNIAILLFFAGCIIVASGNRW